MATKKITELPFINTLSGSSVFDNPNQNVVVPVVLKGTTNQITIENFSKFMVLYSATTGSAGNIFVGPQTINNSLTINGNEIVNGNVNINGRLTVHEVVAQYETASILFSTGSTKLGDEITDKHEFTGSTNITGSLNYNGVLLTNIDANTIHRLQQATQSLQVATASLNQFTSSQDSRNFIISQFTSSTDAHIVGISNFTSSNFDTMARVYQTSASINIFTGSQDSRNFIISQFTSSTDAHIVGISTYTSSQYDTIARVYQTTQSLQVATASLQQFTASQDSRNFVISQYTSSTDAHIVGISAFTSSQLAVNLGNSIYTASVDSHIVGISTYTSSVRDSLARVHQATQSLQVATASLNEFTASQDSRNFTLSQVTGSLIGITNGLMAFTAALDNTYATDAQLYQLYQATHSLELHSGSMIGVTNGLMAYTASNTTLNTGLRGEVDGIEAYTASLKGQAIVSSSTQVQNYDVFALNSNLYTSTGSLIGITNGLMAFTAALDSTYATDAQLYQLYAETASIKAEIAEIEAYTASLKAASIVSSSTQIQNYDLFALNSNLYNGTGSIKGEIAGIEAYTASLKSAAIVSSSQQVQNYFTFAKTGSANTFYGNQSVSGSLTVNSTGTSGISIISSGDNPTLNFTQLAQTNGGARNWRLIPNYDGWGTLDIQVSADNATLPSTTTRVSLTAAGDVNIKTGNLVMGTAGKGIDFSATANSSAGTMSSELLNDYEEGTWTPVITDLTNDASMDGTYTRGSYTKIGRQVTVRGYVLTTSLGSVTGNVKIKGLPFANGGGFASLGGGSIGTASGLNITAGHSVHISTPIGEVHLGLNVGDDATGTTEMTAAEWSADGQIQMLATYFVD